MPLFGAGGKLPKYLITCERICLNQKSRRVYLLFFVVDDNQRRLADDDIDFAFLPVSGGGGEMRISFVSSTKRG